MPSAWVGREDESFHQANPRISWPTGASPVTGTGTGSLREQQRNRPHFGRVRRMARPITYIPTIATAEPMDDLYGNAWGDPVNDYPSNSTYPLPTWNAQPSSPGPSSPAEDGQNNDEENEDPSTEPQLRTDASDTSWTTDAVPWPMEDSSNQYYSVWVPPSPANVWSPTTQSQTPTVPTPTPSDDVTPESPPPTSPIAPNESTGGHRIPSEQTLGTPVQSRASSPDQFGTFESGNTGATTPADGVGWGSPKYSTFDDSVDSSNAWGQQATTKERDTEAEPADEWEAARRMKEKLDRRVVRMPSQFLVLVTF